MLRLYRLDWNVRLWWSTRHCEHPLDRQGRALIDLGRRKMWWCNDCEAVWFS